MNGLATRQGRRFSRPNRVRANLADFDRTLGRGATTLSTGRSVSAEDLGLLCDVHAYLEDKFSRHLTLLRNRVERS